MAHSLSSADCHTPLPEGSCGDGMRTHCLRSSFRSPLSPWRRVRALPGPKRVRPRQLRAGASRPLPRPRVWLPLRPYRWATSRAEFCSPAPVGTTATRPSSRPAQTGPMNNASRGSGRPAAPGGRRTALTSSSRHSHPTIGGPRVRRSRRFPPAGGLAPAGDSEPRLHPSLLSPHRPTGL